MQYFGFDRPSFGIKTYGFGESSSKLSADFTTGTYKANGAAKTFADLFTFTRAGKAWLVKETGLQEYAADVPRLDDGLLIEQSATNHVIGSNDSATVKPYSSTLINSVDTLSKFGIVDANKIVSTATTATYAGLRATYMHPYTPKQGEFLSLQAKVRNNSTSDTLIIHSNQGDMIFNIAPQVSNLYAFNGIKGNGVGTVQLQFRAMKNTFDSHINTTWAHLQVENGIICSSYIPTTTTPVTRPADFLQTKITGTTVTGDWDSTLSLSIVAGQLVHSGYGRIRSLEIN